MLAYQLRAGFAREEHEPLVADFATVDPADRAMLARSMASCGTIYLGINLAMADQTFGPTTVWDTDAPAESGDPTPGSWGGHCVFAWDYSGLTDADVVRLGTWGGWQRATWRWLRSRADEAHVLIWRDLQTVEQRNFAGIDYDMLRAEALAFTA